MKGTAELTKGHTEATLPSGGKVTQTERVACARTAGAFKKLAQVRVAQLGPSLPAPAGRVYTDCLLPFMGCGGGGDRQISPAVSKPLHLKFLYALVTEQAGESLL